MYLSAVYEGNDDDSKDDADVERDSDSDTKQEPSSSKTKEKSTSKKEGESPDEDTDYDEPSDVDEKECKRADQKMVASSKQKAQRFVKLQVCKSCAIAIQIAILICQDSLLLCVCIISINSGRI